MPRAAGWKTIECPVCKAPPGQRCSQVSGDPGADTREHDANGVRLMQGMRMIRRNREGRIAQHPERGLAAWKRDRDEEARG